MSRLSALPIKIQREARRANKRSASAPRISKPQFSLKEIKAGRPADAITGETIHRIQRLVLKSMPQSDVLRMRALRSINAQDCTEFEGLEIVDSLQAIG